jgi:hypothetical protein
VDEWFESLGRKYRSSTTRNNRREANGVTNVLPKDSHQFNTVALPPKRSDQISINGVFWQANGLSRRLDRNESPVHPAKRAVR